MLPANWPKLLTFSLWIAAHVPLVGLVIVLCKRRLYKEFPCFFVYAFYEIASFILLMVMGWAHSVTGEQYAYAYYATLMLSVILRFGVIGEIAKDLFRESPLLKLTARRVLFGVQGLLLVIGILLAVYAPGDNSIRWIAGVSVINRGAAMIQSGLLFSLLLFSRFLGVSWHRHAFGIALGLGILTSVDVAIYALRAQLASNSLVPYLDLLRTGTYVVCILTWIGYLLLPELEPGPLTVVSSEEVETWSTELQHMLRPRQ